MLKHKYSLIAVSLCCVTLFSVYAADLYVALDGSHSGGYEGWETAATNIQDAVDASSEGDTIWISNGVYKLEAAITVPKKLTIRGNEGELIVIDGQNTCRCFNLTGNRTVLSNLFITGGNDNTAGGVNMSTGKIIDCVFSNNNTARYGGALVSSGGGEILNSLFVDNHSASNGGAFYLSGTGTLVKDCRFTQNDVLDVLADSGMGGAIYCSASDSVFDNNKVIGNTAQNKGGGIYMSTGSGNLFTNCYLAENVTMTNDGGGMWSSSSFEISHCNFVSNKTTSGAGGGAYLHAGNLQVKNSCFTYNSSSSLGGGLYLNTTSGGEIRDSLFSHNQGSLGGGIVVFNKNNILINCTIVSNIAVSGAGAGLWSSTSDSYAFTSLNCIVYFNSSLSGAVQNYSAFNANVAFSNNCMYPQFPATYERSAGNISDDPLFVDFNGGDYRLTSESPCINQGVNLENMHGMFDLDGRKRQDRFSGKVDLGCYEFTPPGILFQVY